MKAEGTDEFDLLLQWQDFGHSTVCFSLASESEFTIQASISCAAHLNYQSSVCIELSTRCYAYDLDQFRRELHQLADGLAPAARFVNTGEDFELQITAQFATLRYDHRLRSTEPSAHASFVLPLGFCDHPALIDRAITEVITRLKPDCRHLMELR